MQSIQLSSQQTATEYIILPESERRFEVTSAKSKLSLKLIEGSAEIFGIEMAPNKEYSFREECFAVFTWRGCKILAKSDGKVDTYETGDTGQTGQPMNFFINAHYQLEARRDVALANQDNGPRVLVLGESDQGKSTVCRILTAYAARLDRAPIYVDLDVNQSLVSLPGSISAVQVDKTNLSIDDGILKDTTPIVYYPGIESPISNVDYYKHMVGILSTRVKERIAKDLDAKTSGLIINTNSWVEDKAIDVILHIIRSFEVDIVLVLNNPKLISKFNDLKRRGDLATSIAVESLPSSISGYKVDLNRKKEYRQNRVEKYFYGKTFFDQNTKLFRSKLSLRSLQIYSARESISEGIIGAGSAGSASASEFRELLVQISAPYTSITKGHILAILHPLSEEASGGGGSEFGASISQTASAASSSLSSIAVLNNITKSNVAGFLIVADIYPESDTMIVFSPSPISNPKIDLPSTILFRGSLKHTFRGE